MSKSMNKKQIRTYAIVAMLFISVMNSGGCGCGKDETPSETRTIPVVDDTKKVKDEEVTEVIETEKEQEERESIKEINPSEDPRGDEGGNQHSNHSQAEVLEINVIVSEEEYYYDNAPIPLEKLEKIIEEVNGDKIVVISNNNASQSAYKKLTDTLDKNRVPYTEEQD